MTAADDPLVEELRAAIDAVAEERVVGLVTEARGLAEARVRARLTTALEAAMLDRAGRAMRPDPPPPARSTPSPKERPASAPQTRAEEEDGFYVYGVAAAD